MGRAVLGIKKIPTVFDGVLAFSQGASLAVMHLARKTIQASGQALPFRCAILVSCTAAYNPVAWLEYAEVCSLDPKIHGQLIAIPTVHIWGEQDPAREGCETLSNLCDKSLTTVFLHAGATKCPSSVLKSL